MLKPIATVAETVAKPEMPIEEVQNKENEARELPPTTDVRADLELSQDSEAEEIHGVHIIDLDADLDAQKPFIEFSDVEPDYTAEELAARAQASTAPATTTPTLPEVLFDFPETVVISDDEGVSTTAPSKLLLQQRRRSLPQLQSARKLQRVQLRSVRQQRHLRLSSCRPQPPRLPR